MLQVDYIDSIIASIKSEEEKDKSEMELDPVEAYLRKQEAKKAGKNSSSSGKSKTDSDPDAPERERTQFLQRVLLDYLAVNAGDDDHCILNARHFHICQWYRDANAEMVSKPPKSKRRSKKKVRRGGGSSEDESDESESDDEADLANGAVVDPLRAEQVRGQEDLYSI